MNSWYTDATLKKKIKMPCKQHVNNMQSPQPHGSVNLIKKGKKVLYFSNVCLISKQYLTFYSTYCLVSLSVLKTYHPQKGLALKSHQFKAVTFCGCICVDHFEWRPKSQTFLQIMEQQCSIWSPVRDENFAADFRSLSLGILPARLKFSRPIL